MITLIARFRLGSERENHETKKERNNHEFADSLQKNTNPATPQSWRDLRVSNKRLCSELYVSAQVPPSHAILEFTPDETQSTYASGLEHPRGLAFDSIGNLFVAEILNRDDIDLGRALKFNLRNKVSTVGSAAHFTFEGLATDMAGNAYVMASDDNSPTLAGTIFKFTPDGERIVFGSVPGTTEDNEPQPSWSLAFDTAGYLYAADGGAQTIYKFAPNGARSVFVGPSAFDTSVYPVGLAFDSYGNLFVSTNALSNFSGNDTILEFNPQGVKISTFAMGLSFPRGLAFDTSGNLFVAEVNQPELNQPGDILKFYPNGTHTVFASFSIGRPEFLTFGSPR
jgi:DNA-binding beta-propeller fold protein YncE